MAHTLKRIYIDLRNNENPPFSWQAKDVVGLRLQSQRGRKEEMKRFLRGGALFISHYTREDEESHTDSATFHDNALNFCFSSGVLLRLHWFCSEFSDFKLPMLL